MKGDHKPKKPAAPKAPRLQLVRAFVLDDGDVWRMPDAEYELRLLAEAAAMIGTGEPSLKALGLARLSQAAERKARSRVAAVQSAKNATSKRDSALKPLRERILGVMRPYSRDGTAFKAFMRDWEREALGGLLLVVLGDNEYRIDDRTAPIVDAEPYKYGSLKGMYSEAKNER